MAEYDLNRITGIIGLMLFAAGGVHFMYGAIFAGTGANFQAFMSYITAAGSWLVGGVLLSVNYQKKESDITVTNQQFNLILIIYVILSFVLAPILLFIF